jgi:hypothetical protein
MGGKRNPRNLRAPGRKVGSCSSSTTRRRRNAGQCVEESFQDVVDTCTAKAQHDSRLQAVKLTEPDHFTTTQNAELPVPARSKSQFGGIRPAQLNNNNNTFTWSGPRALLGFTGACAQCRSGTRPIWKPNTILGSLTPCMATTRGMPTSNGVIWPGIEG